MFRPDDWAWRPRWKYSRRLASKGIGSEIAFQLAIAGAAVVVNYASDTAGAGKVVKSIVGTKRMLMLICSSERLQPSASGVDTIPGPGRMQTDTIRTQY